MNIDRHHIGLFGKMNSGKSSLINLITQQQTSITDSTPGTTADTKVALQEIHGLGPVKLFDTAGLNEMKQLGEKKKAKVLDVMKECDLVILVVDPSSLNFDTEKMVADIVQAEEKQMIIVYNLFEEEHKVYIAGIELDYPFLERYPSIELSAVDAAYREKFLNFILENFEPRTIAVKLLPFLERDEFYVLNIPMDEETPPGRLLRPQAMAEEYITRNWAYPVSYRMDLKMARGNNAHIEKARFDAFIGNFKNRPKAIITDSQAMDIMSKWVPSDIALTTFSIMMINYVSKGRIYDFYKGVEALETLMPGDKILIAEACNHSRIKEDIGTVQIPKIIEKKFPGVEVEFNFGREFQYNNELANYKLIVHCGGCMISNQKLNARLRTLKKVDVPITNYGVFLSWAQGKQALLRVMEPWL